MNIANASLIAAAFLCSLVAGFLFAFAVVVMPGIRRLGDGEFIRVFQAMDRIIQNGQPLFMLVWVGSILALVAAVVLSFGHVDGAGRWLLPGVLAAYLLGVQVPTFTVNVPLNNRLQAVDADSLDSVSRASARAAFERRWNSSNVLRTVVASIVSIGLLTILIGI